jgi:hypothetical protein
VSLRRKMENDIERDMRDHIEMETRDNIDRGMPPEEARYAAVRRFGNTMRIAEETRAVWRREWVDRMFQDARHAFRGLRRNPVFAVAAILTLALGMGMSTAVFSVVNSVLIKPLPYPDAGRLVWLANYNKRFHIEASSAPDFADWRDQASSYEAMAGYIDVDCTVQDFSESTKHPFVIITSDFWRIVTNASGTGPARVKGMTFPDGQDPQVRFRSASAGYARVVGLPLIAGRWTTDSETSPAVIVNESFVRRVFAGYEPLGRLLLLQEFNNKPVPIVGVAGDLKTMRLDADAEPEILIPYQETDTSRRVEILFKTPGALTAVLPEARKTVERLDSTQPPYEVRTLEEALSETIAPFRFDLLLLGTFAASAVLLALTGIYGVMSYSVTQRTREIGVRIALHARRGEIARMMLWQAMTVAFAGIAVGTAGALILTRLITTLLYDVKPNDPAIFAIAVTGLAGTCLLASWVPALKAARVEALDALRHE